MIKHKLSPVQAAVLKRLAAGGSIMHFPYRGRHMAERASLENALLNLNTFNALLRQKLIIMVRDTDGRPPHLYTITDAGRKAIEGTKDEQD